MLNLAPETESLLVEEAAREGVMVDTLLRRHFASHPAPASEAARVQGLLTKWQSEYGLPVPPGGYQTTAELFARWNTEDSLLTDQERQAEREAWEQRERERSSRPLQI